MREIKLSQDKVALVDNEDYEWLSQWKWSAFQNRSGYYAVRNERVKEMGGIKRSRKLILMHREILQAKDDMDVDHWDGNGLNNQRYNLRECPHADNMKNQKVNSVNKTGYKGVYWNKKNRKYVANIGVGGTCVYLGSFETAEDAALAYNQRAVEVYGEYARLNIIS
jgi:hypothetical protein